MEKIRFYEKEATCRMREERKKSTKVNKSRPKDEKNGSNKKEKC